MEAATGDLDESSVLDKVESNDKAARLPPSLQAKV